MTCTHNVIVPEPVDTTVMWDAATPEHPTHYAFRCFVCGELVADVGPEASVLGRVGGVFEPAVDQVRVDAVVRAALLAMSDVDQADWIQRFAREPIKVFVGADDAEWWDLVVDDVLFLRVHRSELEAFPEL